MLSVTGYADFSASIHRRYFGKRAPVEVSLEITHRCPLACLHCYNNLPMSDRNAADSELKLADYRQLLDELADAGVLWLLFTGGEVFARKDFLEIYQYAKQKGFLITIFTNGTLINEKIADFLAEWRPFAVEITLYGRTRETYEALTGNAGLYDRCMHAIELLLERGVPLKLKTVPTTINRHEVYEMRDFAEKLGVEFKFDALVNPRTDCSQSPLAVRLSPEEVVDLDFRDARRKAEYRRLLDAEIAKTQNLSDQLYFCGGGMNSCAIDPYGNISICVLSHREHYNIRGKGFLEAWDNFLLQTRTQKRTKPTKCQSCRLQSMCGMCPANGELESGDPETPVEFLCQVAHIRALVLNGSVPEHGECNCCAGGEDYPELWQAAERIRTQKAIVREQDPSVLNILNQPVRIGGCGSCELPAGGVQR